MDNIKAIEIKLVKISDLKFNPENFNKHPESQIEQLMKIIKFNGFRRPITISNRTGFVNCGEGRAVAADRLGMDNIPAMFQDYESEDHEVADAVADNMIDKQSLFDFSAFNMKLPELGPIDIDLFGMKDFKVDVGEIQIKEKELDENIHTDKECPSCGYTW